MAVGIVVACSPPTAKEVCASTISAACRPNAPGNDEALAELMGPLEDFSSPASVNFFLGNLLKLMARKRIDRRDALAQAYICQLLLNTFPHMHRELESDHGPQAMQLLLDDIANSQKALSDAPDSSRCPAGASALA